MPPRCQSGSLLTSSIVRFSRSQFWVWWLLPFLVARALVPVGFMARMSDGHLSLVFCSVSASKLNTAEHSAGIQQNGLVDTANDDQDGSTQADFSCPFSQVAAVPLLDVSGTEAIAYIATSEVPSVVETPYYAVGPPRFIATRGPPILA